MKNTFLFLTLVLIPTLTFGQSFKVKKVKGKQAIVEMTQPGAFAVGHTYTVGEYEEEEEGSLDETSTSGAGSRKYTLAGSAGIVNSTRREGEDSVLTINMYTRFGWNMNKYEVGPIVTVYNSSAGGSQSTTYGLGGFIDYNFTPNRTASQVYGVTGDLRMVTEQNASNTISRYESYVGGFGKYFMLGNATAVRLDAGYTYNKYESYNSTGFGATLGLQIYF